MAKTITLINQQSNEPHEFEWNHAVRLLTQQARHNFTCWNLSPDSPYIFTNGNIITRPMSKRPASAAQREENPEGNPARGTDQDAHGAGNGEG